MVLTEHIHPDGEALLRREANVVNGVAPETLTAADGIIVRGLPVVAALLDRCPRLRVIGKHGSGVDGIDLTEAARRGVAVVNTPDASSDAVAEFTLALILLATRRIPQAANALATGAFAGEDSSLPAAAEAAGFAGRQLSDLTVGLVGFGEIGTRVGRLCTAFGARVLVWDPNRDPQTMAALAVARTPELDVLLATSDVVSLHVRATPKTRLMIGERELGLMRPGSILVNTARSSIVDTRALAAALDAGHLGGAAVDVFDREPPGADDPLFGCPNLLATPHIAALTDTALRSMAIDVADGVLALLHGRRPPHLVVPGEFEAGESGA